MQKPVLYFLYAAVLMALGNNKEGLQYLQAGLNAAPRLVKIYRA